jgi:bla regulator protein blaR1
MIGQLSDWLQPVAAWVLFASLKSIVIIPLVMVIQRLAARWLTPQGRYGLWFAVIACLSIPFGAQMQTRDEFRSAASARSPAMSRPDTTAYEQPIIRVDDAPAAAPPSLSTASKALLIWLAGIAALAIAVLCSGYRYWRMKSRAADVDAPTDALFNLCRHRLRINRPVRILETSQIESPIVVGYWRPTLLLPRNLSTRISKEQLRLVLLHELTHIQRHDILTNWLTTLVQIAHWFNPLVWFALRTMRNDMEHACDAAVLRHLSTSERIEYGNVLIRLSDFIPQRTLLAQNASVIESRTQLKARINMIAQFRSRGTASTLLAAALLALASSVAVTQAANAPQLPASPARQATPAAPAAAPSSPTASRQSTRTTDAPEATAKPQAPKEAMKAAGIPAMESVEFHLKEVKAADLASFIKAAPGSGLLSVRGSIAADGNTNTLFVQDTLSNILSIRQLVTRLDVPLEKIQIETVFAWVDNDFVQELTAMGSPKGVGAIASDPTQGFIALLEAAQRNNRAEIFSSPAVLASNRSQSVIEQSAMTPKQRESLTGPRAIQDIQLKLAFTPTVWPDGRITLNMDLHIDSMMPGIAVPPDNNIVPAINTRQLRTEAIVDSGATVMLTATDWPGRRLVAFVTPKLRLSRIVNQR